MNPKLPISWRKDYKVAFKEERIKEEKEGRNKLPGSVLKQINNEHIGEIEINVKRKNHVS